MRLRFAETVIKEWGDMGRFTRLSEDTYMLYWRTLEPIVVKWWWAPTTDDARKHYGIPLYRTLEDEYAREARLLPQYIRSWIERYLEQQYHWLGIDET